MMARAKPAPARAFTYTAVYDPAPEGGYVVTFPALPDLVTEGETLEEARSMAADALRCYLEGHLEGGLPIPVEEEWSPGAVREAVSIELARAGGCPPSSRAKRSRRCNERVLWCDASPAAITALVCRTIPRAGWW
jgi:antitoxin HicB